MRQTIKSLSDNLRLQVEENGRLHRQIVDQAQAHRARLEAQAKESADAAAMDASLRALLGCPDPAQVVCAVRRLAAGEREAQRAIRERLDLERRVAEELARNRLLAEKTRDPQLEAEAARLRAQLADGARCRDACSALADHYEREFGAGLARDLAALVRQIAEGGDVREIVESIDAAVVSADANPVADLLAKACSETTLRLRRYQRIMENVRQQVENLHRSLDARKAARARQARRPRTPAFASIGKVRAPLRPRNHIAADAFLPRQSPVVMNEPRQQRFV